MRPARAASSPFQSTPSVWRETSKASAKPDRLYFNPLPPCGGRRQYYRSVCPSLSISIHSLRVEGDSANFTDWAYFGISIHSLRVEGDKAKIADTQKNIISIHSLRVEGDSKLSGRIVPPEQFQSTPSVWRETGCANVLYINRNISIHSLRVEGDSRT